jgi:DNA-binding NarL/FixJ family response regulator
MSSGDAVHGSSVADIVGRDTELARVDAFLSASSGDTRALAIRGEPGIGKTTLWRHAVEASRQAGRQVLLTRPAEEERLLVLGGLVDLFEGTEIDTATFRSNDNPIDRGRAVVAALRQVAESGPALVAIDDVQWLDPASGRALRYALRRLDVEPIGILTASRIVDEQGEQLPVTKLLPPGRSEALELRPLDLASVHGVLRRHGISIPRPALRRIHEVSEGNPLFALELARDVRERPASAPRGLELPGSLQDVILERLKAVPEELQPTLEVTSALGRTSVAELRAALPDTDVERLLITAGEHALLAVGADLEVRFAHPLVGSVVYERLDPFARRSVHARLARLTTDPDLRARHLALSTDEPDAAIAREVEEAAERARANGAPDLAAELAAHSLRLTPSDEHASRRRRAQAEVTYLASAGEVGRALALVDRLIEGLPPGPERGAVLVQRAQLEDDDLDASEALLVVALDDAGDDRALRGRVLDQLGWLRGVFRGDLDAGIEAGREALEIAVGTGDRQFEMSAAAGLSNMTALAGRPQIDLMLRAVEIEAEIGRPPLWVGPRVLLSEQLLWAGDLAQARDLLETANAEAEQARNERWRPYGLYDLAAVESAAGNLARADTLLRDAVEAARDAEDTHVESWIFYRLALVATWLGRADQARSAAHRRLETATKRGERPGIARARSVLGLLALSEGNVEGAATELAEAARLLDETGFAHPGAIPALPDAIEALALSGEVDRARELLDRLEQQAVAVGGDWPPASAGRSRGVVLLADGDAARAAKLLGHAAATFEHLGYRPDAGRALLLQGRALLRGGRRSAAAESLADARALFAEIGAALWEARAAWDLDRAAPGRTAGDLTPTESRIAHLVADGLKNREISQALLMSVATVEAHLTRMYRKLGIRSRSELTRLVAEDKLVLSAPRDAR